MPTCVPVSNNNVTDVNANKPPATNDSKLHKIMACLFWKKKTDVVDMKKDSVTKKQKLTVDRSERSRRVLKMESMRELPKQPEESETNTKVQTSASKQMFLPSENPTASFLSYINPSVRRACSDVIKTSTESLKPKSKEAFVQEARPVRTRNTNYRSQRATDREPVGKGILGKPPKLPTRTQSQTQSTKKPIVVPGIMAGSDDDIGYNSDNDIDDLHEEMRRMNLSHPDLRNVNATNPKSRRRREGSISVSENSDASSNNEKPEISSPSRPQNPSPVDMHERTKQRTLSNETDKDDAKKTAENTPGRKKKSMEQVIDALFQQTQNNLDTIYQNGLEQLEEIETYRAETATPETCMRRLEEHLRETSDEESNPNTNGAFVNRKASASGRKDNKTDKKSNDTHTEGNEKLEEYVPDMDGLLTEVSVWAKDRQSWLLNEGKRENIRREDTSVSFNDRVIDHVTRSNDDKCTEWVESQNKELQETSNNGDSKVSGILTGPKLFRSSSRQANQRRIGFSENDTNQVHEQNQPEEQINRLEPNVKFLNNQMSRNGLLVGNAPNVVNLGSLPGFGRQSGQQRKNDEDNFSLMYCDDRSTIDDNLSDMEQPPNYPSRSPDSWISSVVSYPNRVDQNADNHNDSFEGSVPNSQRIRDKQQSPAKRSASSPAKSHQIVRIAPKIYTPFTNIEKPKINKPFIGESKSFSGMNKPMIRNTQLRPLPASRPPRPMEMINQMSGLDTLSSNSFSGTSGRNVYRGSRNMLSDLDTKIPVADVSQRPYSEIPLRASSLTTYDKLNSSDSKQDEPPPYMPRPVSETVPMKKIDKIGMGQVMATDSTKERNKYAREVVNSFHKNRIHSQSAFDETQEEKGQGQQVDNQENKHKRHTVFNNSLLKGGYTYDKHSRTRSRENSVKHSLHENQGSEQTDSSGNISNASTSQLHLSVADSFRGTNHSIDKSITTPTYVNQGNVNPGETALASGGKNVQSHIHGISSKEPPLNEDINKTAARFKRLRSRRDQEIEWLMKDAAETEV